MAYLEKNFEFEQDGKMYSLYDLPDGFVIKGNVDLSDRDLTELPDLSKVTIIGGFYCHENQLTYLRGAPQEVFGDFSCYENQLTSLQGAPQKVIGSFDCHDNQLTSLEGAPQEVAGDFDCYANQLTTLQGAQQKVGKGFYCHENQLTSLHGAPQKIDGDFACEYNDGLSSLFGIPEMSEYDEISCDKALMEKYGCPESDNEGIYYKDLIASTKYQSELSAHKIRQKKHEENKVNQAQFKAGYAAFKKKFKPAEREE
jgi:hypothetical protein